MNSASTPRSWRIPCAVRHFEQLGLKYTEVSATNAESTRPNPAHDPSRRGVLAVESLWWGAPTTSMQPLGQNEKASGRRLRKGAVMNPPTDTDLQSALTAEFLALADLLDALPETEWDTPSLCAGWRVREVVAHMTMPARYSVEQFQAELRDCEFDFTRLSNHVASRDGALPVSVLVGNLRDDVLHRWTPPGGGYRGALNHAVIHGLDISVPLGVPRRASDETIGLVLDDLARRRAHAHFGA